jgi:two-component system, OmpR family, response regulator
LQGEDRSVECVYDAREALEHLRETPYDAVVAEQIRRNGSSGLGILRRLRSVRPDTKVILAGERNPAGAVAAIRAHAYGYLHVPPAAGPLADMVQAALESSSWQDDLRITSVRPEWVTLNVRCKLPAVERATHLVREWTSEASTSVCEDATAAFRELLMNAIEHGGRWNERKRVRVSLLRTSRAVMVHMSDPGKGFSFTSLPHAAVANPEDSPTRHVEIRAEQGQRPGGFGILLVSKLVDELLYNERGNEVFFVKNLT